MCHLDVYGGEKVEKKNNLNKDNAFTAVKGDAKF